VRFDPSGRRRCDNTKEDGYGPAPTLAILDDQPWGDMDMHIRSIEDALERALEATASEFPSGRTKERIATRTNSA
jgi:hypothetical protein